jgi:hypothetical protein
LAPALGAQQTWTLVDYDADLLAAARETLRAWADHAVEDGKELRLHKQGKDLQVTFRQADLSGGLAPLLSLQPDCVTASALFDLCSTDFIADAVRAIVASGAIFYTVLTYDGIEEWTPPHEADAAIFGAFIAHQKTDKGFGVSAGPDAHDALVTQFVRAGYAVHEASTPWLLTASRDHALMAALANGIANAARETGQVSPELIVQWLAARQSAQQASIGHRDLLAYPRPA